MDELSTHEQSHLLRQQGWEYSLCFSLHGSWAGIRVCGDGVMFSFVLFVWPGFARLAFGGGHQGYESQHFPVDRGALSFHSHSLFALSHCLLSLFLWQCSLPPSYCLFHPLSCCGVPAAAPQCCGMGAALPSVLTLSFWDPTPWEAITGCLPTGCLPGSSSQDFGVSRLQLMVETLESSSCSPFPCSRLISHPSVFREGYTDGFDQWMS